MSFAITILALATNAINWGLVSSSDVSLNSITQKLRSSKSTVSALGSDFKIVKQTWGDLIVHKSVVPKRLSTDFQEFLKSALERDQIVLASGKSEAKGVLESLEAEGVLGKYIPSNGLPISLQVRVKPSVTFRLERNGSEFPQLLEPRWNKKGKPSITRLADIDQLPNSATDLSVKVAASSSSLSHSKILRSFSTWVENQESQLLKEIQNSTLRLSKELFEANPGLENFINTKGGATGALTSEGKKWIESKLQRSLDAKDSFSKVRLVWVMSTSIKTDGIASYSVEVPLEDLFPAD